MSVEKKRQKIEKKKLSIRFSLRFNHRIHIYFRFTARFPQNSGLLTKTTASGETGKAKALRFLHDHNESAKTLFSSLSHFQRFYSYRY